MKTVKDLQLVIDNQEKLEDLEKQVKKMLFIHPKQVKMYNRFLAIGFELLDFYDVEGIVILQLKHKDLKGIFELSRFDLTIYTMITIDYVIFSDISDEDMFEILKNLSAAVDISFSKRIK